MSLILTPPPTVMVFFKEISLKNESTGLYTRIIPYIPYLFQTLYYYAFLALKTLKFP